jgi:EVE domain
MNPRQFWIGVVSKNHVAIGVAGGFTQLNHGKAGPLERMRPGDGFAFYSPRDAYPDGPVLQAFTAIGRVREGEIFQAEPDDGFRPFRRAVEYLPATDAPIKPLIEGLTFIRSKQHWGAAFRFGFLKVPEEDFARIAAAMGRDFATDFAPNGNGSTQGVPEGPP